MNPSMSLVLVSLILDHYSTLYPLHLGKEETERHFYTKYNGNTALPPLSCAPSRPFFTPVHQMHVMQYCTLLNSGSPLTLFDHNLKTNGYSGRDKIKIMETKSALGMLEWLQPLEVLWKVADYTKFLLKTKYLGCQVTQKVHIRENRS